MKDEITLLIDGLDITNKEKEDLLEYSNILLKDHSNFSKNLNNLKSNVEFSKAIIDIIRELKEDEKNVKRNT
jgi:hypothetical protein